MPSDTFAAGIEAAARYVLDNSRRGNASLNDEQFAHDTEKLMTAYRDIIGKAVASGHVAFTPTASEATAIGAGEEDMTEIQRIMGWIDQAIERAKRHGNTEGIWLLGSQWRTVRSILAAATPKVASDTAPGVAAIIRSYCKDGVVPEPFGGSLDTADLAAVSTPPIWPLMPSSPP